LAQRLKARPNDAEGWTLLARSYSALGRFPEAVEAYSHASALTPEDPPLLADYADALAMAQGRPMAGKPTERVQSALAIDPANRKALALAATAALEGRDLDTALRHWKALAAQLPQGSDEARQVAQVISEVEAAKTRVGAKGSAVPGVQGRDGTASSQTSIRGRVDIDAALADKVALTDTVFVFARAAKGPRMPLAVLRLAAKDLPRDFALDDSMAMAAGAKLSSADAVVVEARISKTGNASPQPGDFFGQSAEIKPGTASVHITIDQTVK